MRGRKEGSWAFALNRLTGIGLALYLFMHLGVLTTLLKGEEAWNSFIAIAKTPPFLALDVILLLGLVFHGLNGIRVALVGMGIGVNSQQKLFWILMAAGLILFVIGGYLILAIEG